MNIKQLLSHTHLHCSNCNFPCKSGLQGYPLILFLDLFLMLK